jgi:adenosine deaminase CECR1
LAEFDEKIYRSITLGEEDLTEPDIWEEFSNCFRRSFGLFSYDPLYEGFCRKMLKDVAEENIQYVEFRGILGRIDEILKEIQHNHPEFNVKYVYCGGRSNDHEQVAKSLNWLLEQRKANPHLIKGFDLVEEEDRTHTNLYFINELLNARREAEKRNITLPLYLHSGESNWVENENVYDAILLDAKRIGHGLALVKHPLLMQIVKERNIAIEICPISNQVLGYIPDLRNHPAVTYINSGLPIVLSPDDPGIMPYTFSYDFYVAFMAWGLDLSCLKQLAVNSLLYSAMDPEEKNKALETWKKKWAGFAAWLAAYPLN